LFLARNILQLFRLDDMAVQSGFSGAAADADAAADEYGLVRCD